MRKLLLNSIILLLLYSCSDTQISEETPYTVQIKEIRSYYKAKDIEERVKSKGIDAYITGRGGNEFTINPGLITGYVDKSAGEAVDYLGFGIVSTLYKPTANTPKIKAYKGPGSRRTLIVNGIENTSLVDVNNYLNEIYIYYEKSYNFSNYLFSF